MLDQKAKKHYKTIILSDLHLGTAGCKASELLRFFGNYSCDTLILNGDIIDGWELKRYGRWQKKHTRVFKMILEMMESFKTDVLYLHGNHDDFVDDILPLKINNFSLQTDFIYESFGKRHYILHGDIFDSVSTNQKWLAQLGSLGYTFLIWLNRIYDIFQNWRGKATFSFSQYIKTSVKKSLNRRSHYEIKLVEMARKHSCEYIICGHTHQAMIKPLEDGIVYMNSGDWVDSLTALLQDEAGNWELYKDIDHYPRIDKNSENKDIEGTKDFIDHLQNFFVQKQKNIFG